MSLQALHSCAAVYFKFALAQKLRHKSLADTIVFIDIDNTIADTWPGLVNNTKNARERCASIPVLKGMREYVIRNFLSRPKTQVVYISARGITLYGLTQKWLTGNGFWKPGYQLILVQNPAEKIRYISSAANSKLPVIYIDDLSYNHEQGSVKLYNNVIQTILQMPVQYIGHNQITAINNAYKDI